MNATCCKHVFVFWIVFVSLLSSPAFGNEKKDLLLLHSSHQGLVWTVNITKGIQSVYGEYKYLIWNALFVFSLLLAIIVVLVINILRRKRALEALQESEERYRSLIELSPDPIVILQDGKYQFINLAFTRIFGYTQQDVDRGLSFFELVQEHDKEAVRKQYERRLAGESVPKTYRIDLVAKDGTIVPCETSATVISYKGQPADFVIIRDITKHKQAEEALREGEEKYRTLFEHLPIPVFTKNREGKYTSCNAENQRYWAVNPIGRTDAELLDPQIAAALREADLRVMETGETLTVEEYLADTPLGVRQVLSRKVPLRDGSGHIVGILGVSLDITERKRAEEALHESNQKLKTLFDTSPLAIITLDSEKRVTLWSPAAEKIFGWTAEEVIGKPFPIVPKDKQEDLNKSFEAFFKGKPYSFEDVRRQRKDGSLIPVSVAAAPLRDAEGQVIGALGIITDITERKRAKEELQQYHEHLEELVKERTVALEQEIEEHRQTEVQLQQAKEAAESANKLKSEFLANVSHDIRTPLNAVLGFAQILKDRLSDIPQYQTYLDRIMEGGHTLLHLINDILDLSLIEAGQLEIRPEPVTLPTVLTEIQQMFAPKAQEKGIQLTTQIGLDTPRTVLLDDTRLRQILMNLVGNAVKFTEKGSVTLRVKKLETGYWKLEEQRSVFQDRASQSPVSSIQFQIEDTGLGIPQDDLERMFEPFQRHDRRTSGGTGLGLAITQRLVELMHGTITVESTVNKGTLFRVLLPATELVAREEGARARKLKEQIRFHGATVLLVEDDTPNREVVRAFTADCDLRLIEAENGQEALQMLKPESADTLPSPPREESGVGFRPDLILMDLRMPVVDGYEATKLIKADPELRAIPVVALTAYATKEQVEQYQDLFDAYLTKPISKRELLVTLGRFLPYTRTSVQKTGQEERIPPLKGTQRAVEERDMLEELKAYVAHTGPFPQAFLDTLHVELLPKHKETSELMSVDEMIAFAETVIAVADAFTVPALKSYGEELLRSTKVFDVINMKHLLALFPEIVETISK